MWSDLGWSLQYLFSCFLSVLWAFRLSRQQDGLRQAAGHRLWVLQRQRQHPVRTCCRWARLVQAERKKVPDLQRLASLLPDSSGPLEGSNEKVPSRWTQCHRCVSSLRLETKLSKLSYLCVSMRWFILKNPKLHLKWFVAIEKFNLVSKTNGLTPSLGLTKPLFTILRL